MRHFFNTLSSTLYARWNHTNWTLSHESNCIRTYTDNLSLKIVRIIWCRLPFSSFGNDLERTILYPFNFDLLFRLNSYKQVHIIMIIIITLVIYFLLLLSSCIRMICRVLRYWIWMNISNCLYYVLISGILYLGTTMLLFVDFSSVSNTGSSYTILHNKILKLGNLYAFLNSIFC